MALTPAQLVLKQPNAKAITALVLEPTDPVADGLVVLQTVSDLGFTTAPDDVLQPSRTFKPLIAKGGGLTLTESLTSPGKLTGDAEINAGRVLFVADEDLAENWPRFDWNGRPMRLYLGAREGADGQPMVLNDFDFAFEAKCKKLRAVSDGQFQLSFTDLTQSGERAHVEKLYLGFGGAVAVRTAGVADGTFLRQNHFLAMEIIGNEMTIDFSGILENVVTTGAGPTPILMNGNNAPVDLSYGLFINDVSLPGTLAFGSDSEILDSGFTIPVGVFVYLAVVVSDGDEVTFYAGVDGDDVEEVGSGVLAAPLAVGPQTFMQIGQADGSEFSPAEIRLFEQSHIEEELQVLADGPVTDALLRTTLIESWRFSEGQEVGLGPEFFFGEKGVIDFFPVGDPPVWSSSLTGDDADEFDGSPSGQTLSEAYGAVSNLLLVRIDSQRHVFGWDSQVSKEVSQLRIRGIPMVREHSVTSAAPGELVFATDQTITITNPAIGSFAPFIPGQFLPTRLGQRIEIEGAVNPLNLGIFRVAIDGVSSDGLVLKVADRQIAAEAAPATTSIFSFGKVLGNGDIQYRADLSRSVAFLGSDPDGGEITGDIIGRLPPGGVARWTELHELISGASVDISDVVLDPVLGFFLRPDSGLTRNQLLSRLARSAYGWWVPDATGGGHRLGNFVPPDGNPAETLRFPILADVDSLNDVDPFWRFRIGHSKNWKEQEFERLSSITDTDRQRFGKEFTFETRTDRRVLAPYPDALAKKKPFETFLVEFPDVLTFKALASAMILVRRRWYRLTFNNLWPLNVQLFDVVRVFWDDISLGLVGGVDCRVTGREIATGPYRMTLEVYTEDITGDFMPEEE